MEEGHLVSMIWGVGALVLVGSALASRRLPGRQLFKLALVWAAIFTVGALAVRLLELA